MRGKNRQLENEESEKRKHIEEGRVELERLKDKYDSFNTKNMCAQERLKQLVEIVEAEEKNIRVLNDETTRLAGALYRAQQQLFSMKQEDKLLIVEANAIESGIVKIAAAIKANEKELIRQTEIAYNIDFNMEQIEIRMANLKGENVLKSKDDKGKCNELLSLFLSNCFFLIVSLQF
jgi:chromosome segregation ATPase